MRVMRKAVLALTLMTSPLLASQAPPAPRVGPPPIVGVGPTIPGTPRALEDDAPPPAIRAQARANAASYVRDGDYPPSAVSADEQGRVTFRLRIGPDGRVLNCDVIGSSGSLALDQATCRIMRSRARFTPARDAEGTAVTDVQIDSIAWFLAPR